LLNLKEQARGQRHAERLKRQKICIRKKEKGLPCRFVLLLFLQSPTWFLQFSCFMAQDKPCNGSEPIYSSILKK
jgi:hypothetical protein